MNISDLMYLSYILGALTGIFGLILINFLIKR